MSYAVAHMHLRAIIAFAALTLAACYESHPRRADGDLPLAASMLEIELNSSQYRELCEWFHRQMGWPDEMFYYCLDGGAVGRINDPRGCVRNRHRPIAIPECRIRVEDWYACAEHYVVHGACGVVPRTCFRPAECLDIEGTWDHLHP